MTTPAIRNVVFDIGNVLVKWSPTEIITRSFGNTREVSEFAQLVFQHEVWLCLNRGLVTEGEVKDIYRRTLGFRQDEVD